jgi:hypothetical protein
MGHPRVVGEHADEPLDVGGLEGIHEPADDLPLAQRAGRGRAVTAGGGDRAAERGTGALEGTVHRDLAGLQHPGGLGRGIAEHVAQHQDGALPRRQALQPGHERQRERLPGLVAGLGSGRGVGQIVQQSVRVRLEPQGPLLEPVKPAPGCQQGFLQRVLSVLDRAENPVAVHLQLLPAGLGELAERIPVAAAPRACSSVRRP